jgi:FlaA1/EpsC-like NDP-sugar epimerase
MAKFRLSAQGVPMAPVRPSESIPARIRRARPHTRVLLLDQLAWIAGVGAAEAVRTASGLPVHGAARLALLAAVAVLVQTALGAACGLYSGRYVIASFDEVHSLVLAVVATTAVVAGVTLVTGSAVTASIAFAVLCGLVALNVSAGVRYLYRARLQRDRRPRADAEPLIVFGAGDAGTSVVRAMLDPRSPYRPVALLDDDPRKQNLQVRGVPVAGGRNDLAATADRVGASTVLVAVPSADVAVVSELARCASDAGLTVKVLPPVSALRGGRVRVSDIRDMEVTDLLGRRQIDIDLDAAAGYLTGKRVLVTGAGGSIGSELCRQLHRFGPAELIMLDRDESALHAVQLSLHGRALLDSPETVLADIRDTDGLRRVFEERRPHVVFHAAALKHLPLLEQFPGEALQTNVWATITTLEAARAVGVERFVNISTDKAANAVSVLGYSKRISERLTAFVARELPGRYVSVRFGNVLASRGSVLGAFTAQADAGGPITVTDPEVTRYFMTIPEATQLVIEAGALVDTRGDVLVLDMGSPVRIADVAQRIADNAPGHVELVFTGLRPGEKLHEDLLDRDDERCAPVHPLISRVRVPPLDPEPSLRVDRSAPPGEVRDALRRLALTEGVRRAGRHEALAGLDGEP